MFDDQPDAPTLLNGLWHSWSGTRLLFLAVLLVLGNFACQILWYQRTGGLFAPVLAGAVAGVLLPLWLMGRRWHWEPARDFRLNRPTAAAAAGSVVMALAALAPGSLLAQLSMRVHPVDPIWLEHFEKNMPQSWPGIALAVVAVVIVAPLAEELIFRGLIHRLLSRTWGRTSAIVASSLIFGLVHGEPWYLFGLIAVGLMLAFVFEATGSLTACWLAHAVHNGVSLAMMVAEGSAVGSVQSPGASDYAVAAGSLAVLFVVGRWMLRSRFVEAELS